MSDLGVFYSRLAMVGIIMVLGFCLGKAKWISDGTNKQLINILLMVAMPAALFMAFQRQEFNEEALRTFLVGLGAGALVLVSLAVLGKLMFSKWTLKKASQYARSESQFALIFNNAAFLGLPIINVMVEQGVFGQEALMAYCGFIIPFNFGLFGYGVYLMKGKFDRKLLVSTLLNPNILAVALGCVLFVFSVGLPGVVTATVDSVAGMMTPLSLICIGYMLSRADVKKLIRKRRLFITAAVQLTVGPTLTWVILWGLGVPAEVRNILVLIQALPTATSLGLFAEKYGGDPVSASELVVISTIMSIGTLPLMLGLLLA